MARKEEKKRKREKKTTNLIKVKHTRQPIVQPNRVAHALPKLLTRARREEGHRQTPSMLVLLLLLTRKELGRVVFVDKVEARDDVAPLVGSPELEVDLVGLVEV